MMTKDENLLKALANDDTSALNSIIGAYSGYVCAVVRNFSRGALTEEDIDDLAADVFYKLWSCRRKLNIRTCLKAYLSGIARNAVKDRFRKLPPVSEDISELEIPSGCSVSDKAELAEMIACLYDGISRLRGADREIVFRFYFYGQKSAQIAQAMGIAENTVYTKLSRSRNKLRDYLTERGFDYV